MIIIIIIIIIIIAITAIQVWPLQMEFGIMFALHWEMMRSSCMLMAIWRLQRQQTVSTCMFV